MIPSEYCLVYEDARWNSWRWRPILQKWGHLKVAVNPNVIKTATFLVINGEPISTVFFVRFPLGEPTAIQGYAYYAVTTLHSVCELDVSIRFNLKAGGRRDELIPKDDWIKHPSTDIAILPIEFPLDEYDIAWVNFTRMADKHYLTSRDDAEGGKTEFGFFGTGDEVFTIGLFEGHIGERLAQPAMRFGHIALKLAEGEKISAAIPPLSQKNLVPIDAFLMEVATWQGQSGSPVFLYEAMHLSKPDKPIEAAPYYLIGMIQGLYPAEQNVKINGEDATFSPLNMGLGIVIPSKDIKEMLMSEDLKDKREKKLEDIRQTPKVRPEPASRGTKDNAFSRSHFEDALKRASRKIAPNEETKEDAE